MISLLPLALLLSSSPVDPLATLDLPSVLPPWTITTDLSLAAGYRSNLLLSPTNPESSPLVRLDCEVMFMRAPVRHFDGFVFVSVSETRFPSGENSDHERTAILSSEIRWQPTDAWKLGWEVQAYHDDQVVDVSITDASLSTARLAVTGLAAGPSLRWTHGRFFAETKFTGRHDRFRDDLDAYDEAAGSARLGWNFTPTLELAVNVSHLARDHDAREQFTLGGRPLAGSHLVTRQETYAAELKRTFGAERQHHASLVASHQRSRDNGSGYFDTKRDLARLLLHTKTENWTHDFTVEYSHYDFPQQAIGFGLEPESRHINDLRITLEIVRRLSPTLALFATAEHEQSRSNDDRSRYTVNTAYAGVRWSWDNLDRWLSSL